MAFSEADTAIVMRDSGGRERLNAGEPLGKPRSRNFLLFLQCARAFKICAGGFKQGEV